MVWHIFLLVPNVWYAICGFGISWSHTLVFVARLNPETNFQAATFQSHFFWPSANVIEMIFAQLCVFQWTKAKLYFERVFYHFTIFGFKNAKNQFFEENKGFEGIIFELKYMRFQTRLADLKNTHNLWIFAEERNFMILLKKAHFPIFSKIINCTYLYQLMRFILCKHFRTSTIQLE